MKKLFVNMKMGLEVPDDWELVRTREGVEVVLVGDNKYLDINFTPHLSDAGLGTQVADADLEDSFFDMVKSVEAEFLIQQE